MKESNPSNKPSEREQIIFISRSDFHHIADEQHCTALDVLEALKIVKFHHLPQENINACAFYQHANSQAFRYRGKLIQLGCNKLNVIQTIARGKFGVAVQVNKLKKRKLNVDVEEVSSYVLKISKTKSSVSWEAIMHALVSYDYDTCIYLYEPYLFAKYLM